MNEIPKHLWRCIGTNPYTCKDYRCPVHGSGDALKCTCGTEFELYCPKCDQKNLLHKQNDSLLEGCYCKPGQCMAPVIMGRQMPCRDPEKAHICGQSIGSGYHCEKPKGHGGSCNIVRSYTKCDKCDNRVDLPMELCDECRGDGP